MALEKWNPVKELESMRREMDKIWGELFPAGRRGILDMPWRRAAVEKGVATPAIDIVDKGPELLVLAEMPGVSKENTEISLQENTLTIKGKIMGEEIKQDEYYYSERGYCCYERSIDIPFKINAEKIKASLKDGVLTVHLPKAEEVLPKKIRVEVA